MVTGVQTCLFRSPPRHRRDERGAQCYLGLAEADVAAHQPVHGLAALQVVQGGVDAGLLRLQHSRGAQRAQGGGLEQFVRNRADPLFQAALVSFYR